MLASNQRVLMVVVVVVMVAPLVYGQPRVCVCVYACVNVCLCVLYGGVGF